MDVIHVALGAAVELGSRARGRARGDSAVDVAERLIYAVLKEN